MASLGNALKTVLEQGKTSFTLDQIPSTDATNFVEAIRSGDDQHIARKDFFEHEGDWSKLPEGELYWNLKGESIALGNLEKKTETSQDMAGRKTVKNYQLDINTPKKFSKVSDKIRQVKDQAFSLSIEKNITKTDSNTGNTSTPSPKTGGSTGKNVLKSGLGAGLAVLALLAVGYSILKGEN